MNQHKFQCLETHTEFFVIYLCKVHPFNASRLLVWQQRRHLDHRNSASAIPRCFPVWQMFEDMANTKNRLVKEKPWQRSVEVINILPLTLYLNGTSCYW